MIGAKHHQEQHEKELFETDEAIQKYLKNALQLSNRVTKECQKMRIWKQPKFSQDRFVRQFADIQ